MSGLYFLFIFFSLGFIFHESQIFFPMIHITARRNKISMAYDIKELLMAGIASAILEKPARGIT